MSAYNRRKVLDSLERRKRHDLAPHVWAALALRPAHGDYREAPEPAASTGGRAGRAGLFTQAGIITSYAGLALPPVPAPGLTMGG